MGRDKIAFVTTSAEETERLGMEMAPLLRAGDTVLLSGDLGAGKTTFTSGIVKGLGGRGAKSPSFVIAREYPLNPPVFHIDFYKVDEGEARKVFEEYAQREGIIIVEWGAFLESSLNNFVAIEIAYGEGENERIIKAYGEGRGKEVVEEWGERVGRAGS